MGTLSPAQSRGWEEKEEENGSACWERESWPYKQLFLVKGEPISQTPFSFVFRNFAYNPYGDLQLFIRQLIRRGHRV